MLDSILYPYVEPKLKSLATLIKPLNLSANAITAIGFVFALLTFISLLFGNHLNALLFILINRLMDGLDGVVARQHEEAGEPGGVSDFGAYLDIVSDFIFYAGVVFFFAWGTGGGHNAMAAAWLIFSYVGSSTTFLTYAIFSERRGLPQDLDLTDWAHSKGFFYLGGLAEGAETLIYMVLICLLPALFLPASLIFGVLCWATTVTRIVSAFDHLVETEPKKKSASKKKKSAVKE